MRKALLTAFGLLIINLFYGQEHTDKLDIILNRLEEIKTASYYSISSSSSPGDTLVFHTYDRYINMYINPTDTFLGAGFSTSSIDDHYEFDLCYDGTYCVRFDWSDKSVEVDTLTNDRYRRPIAPFFVRVKSLIEYAKDNIDSSIVTYQEFRDSIKIYFYFEDRIVEFDLNSSVWESVGKVSRYELIVDKNFLPNKLIRRMPHQTSWETCTNIRTSQHLDYVFSAIQQIPVDFEIKGLERIEPKSYELEGKLAPDWKLKEIGGDSIALSELKHEVILIQFTGIGCGPCHASIPFLKQLVVDKIEDDFELLCIETWSMNISGIERYKDKNEIYYKFLVSRNEVKNNYKVKGVPTFYILDENKIIKKVIVGYQKGVTDKEIIKIIYELL